VEAVHHGPVERSAPSVVITVVTGGREPDPCV
jgi:D-tyrosyl-tRNA(Tyr) deacylase